VKSLILDSAYSYQEPKKTVRRYLRPSRVRPGSPPVTLANDGIVEWTISDSMPARWPLMKFAGQPVTVTGKVFERGGSRSGYRTDRTRADQEIGPRAKKWYPLAETPARLGSLWAGRLRATLF